MSVKTFGIPKRSASWCALGPSASHSETSSVPLSLASAGRCATCAIAPAPTTPMRMEAFIVPGAEGIEKLEGTRRGGYSGSAVTAAPG